MTTAPIDLSQLPVPDVIEIIDFETLLASRKARFLSMYPEDERAEVAATLTLESEPIVRLLQENAYRELILRQRVNDAARALMLAYSNDGDLDNLAAFYDIERQTITPADPDNGIAAVMESNTDLRARVQLAPQGFSVAGPERAYVSHARNADARVLDASAVSPEPAEVIVAVLSRDGDGIASEDLLEAVRKALTPESVRPLGDRVDVQSAEVLRYAIRARLTFFSGPDRSIALAAANQSVKAYTERMHRLGMEITLDGIYAAARQPGVQKVELETPLADIPVTLRQAPFCTGITLIDAGVYGHE